MSSRDCEENAAARRDAALSYILGCQAPQQAPQQMPAFMLQRGEATPPQFRWQDVALEHCPAFRMNRLAIALLVAMLMDSGRCDGVLPA
jgi:hypothetical protein